MTSSLQSTPSRTASRRAQAFFAITAAIVAVAIVSDVVLTATADTGTFDETWKNVANIFCYFTICSNLVAGVTSAVLAIRTPTSAWFWAFRLSSVPAMITTGVVYHALLGGDFEGWRLITDHLLHTVVPILVPVGWLVFGPRGHINRRIVGLSLVWPIAWLVLTEVRGALFGFYPYEFMDPGVTGGPEVVVTIAVIFALFVIMAFGAWRLDRRLTPSQN